MATAPAMVALRPGDRAGLLVDDALGLPALVATTSARDAVLVLDRAAARARSVRLLHRRPAVLAVTRAGTRFEAPGEVTIVAGRRGKVREGVLRFRFAAGERLRAREPRAPAILPVTLVPVHAGPPVAHGLTVNVSAGGALVHGARTLAPGMPVGLELHLRDEDGPAGPPLPAAGRVVRATPDGLRALRLDRVRPGDRDRLARWVAARAAARPSDS